MKKGLILAAALAALGLTGCVAYDPYYGGYVAPSVVVAPSYYGHYSYHRGPRHHHYRDYR